MHLTSYFAHRDPGKLAVARIDWYRENGIEIHVGERAREIDRERRVVVSEAGLEVPYDRVVLATGSRPFVPPIEGVDKRGVFVYRTIEDLGVQVHLQKSTRKVLGNLRIQVGQGITGWVAEQREAVAIAQDAMRDGRFRVFRQLPEDGFQAILSVPSWREGG